MSSIEKIREATVLETLTTSSQHLLSIVIPTKDRADFLKRALCSVKAQNFHDMEIIVVNDGSSICYDDVITQFENIRYFKIEHSKGVSNARNFAIERAMGRWIVFLDDDDEFAPHYLKSLAKEIHNFPGIGLFWSDVTIEIKDTNTISTCNRIWPRKFVSEEHLNSTALSIGASFGLAINRSYFFSYGMFDQTYKICEDIELITRFISSGIKIKPISRIGVIKYESHIDRLSEDLSKYSIHYFYERILDSYQDFFSKNPICKKHILRWALKVHHQVGNRNGVFGLTFPPT